MGKKLIFAAMLTFTMVVEIFSATETKARDATDQTHDLSSHSVGSWGIDLSDRDASVTAGDDFYVSQNGAWLARTELTAEAPNAAYWRDLRLLSPRRLIAILEKAAQDRDAAPNSPLGKAGAFYRAFMDEGAVEKKGLQPLKKELDSIRHATSKEQLAQLMGRIAGTGTTRSVNLFGRPLGRALFLIDIAQDLNDPSRYAVCLSQGGLLLPGPEYYLDPQLADIKVSYEMYVRKMLTLIGWADPQVRAKEIVAFETSIAQVSWSHEQMNDVIKTNNPITVAALSRFAPDFDWRSFLIGAELPNVTKVSIDAKDAFPKIAAIYARTPPEVLQARQAFALVDATASELNDAAYSTFVDFRTKILNGGPRVERSLRAVSIAGTSIDEILGSLYVKQYFSPSAKAKAQEMANTLKSAFDQRLKNVTWMGKKTKTQARNKLSRLSMHIGYPEIVPDYKDLQISDSDLYGDVRRSAAYKWQRKVKRLNTPFDKSEWAVTPDYPNYNYVAATNTLEIPAALLQPPFFDESADVAVNYGAVGSVIGTVMVATFDEQGRLYDANGRFGDWWTPEEVRHFDSESRKLIEQYSSVQPLPGINVKGAVVVNESIDDLGGMLVAIDAYHLALHGSAAPVLDGFSGDQRVFLGRAQMWRAKFGTAFARNQLATGVNSPPFLRVNGPVRNIDSWYEAFNVGPKEKLYIPPEQRARIW